MAKVIFGVATSHSPNLSTPVDKWDIFAANDRNRKTQHYKGKYLTYNELLETRKAEGLAAEVSEEKWATKYEQWEQRIAEVQQKVAQVAPDILVVLGDDQRELFLDDGMPAFSVFWGDAVEVLPPDHLPPFLEPSRWANFGERQESYTTHPELGKHIIESMIADGFDLAQLTRQAEGRGIGHSFIFTRQRVMTKDKKIPMVPIMVNTYYPPNQPTVARCYEFGKALRKAIESWNSDKTVAIVASGGLSHFTVDEELDRRLLKALMNKDQELLGSIREEEMQEGTSEGKNWIIAAGALEDKNMKLIDYIPAYRTEAGTGCGMAFAWWE